ncbi:MAG: alpha/beta hydrolase [Planctomycetia bacterium]|nr:alpha/beta hydrolase [Planctomycetia bacterium]
MHASRVGLTGSSGGLTAVIVILFAGMPSPAAEPPRDWSGVELAWRNDPRAASDASLPVEPQPSRRPSRRGQRRSSRRGFPEPVVVSPFGQEFGQQLGPEIGPRASQSPADAGGLDAGGTIRMPLPAADATRGVVVHRDHSYGNEGHARQRLDIHLPEGCIGGGLPLVIWIHGPDWRTGTKADCPIAWLAREGYAVASVGYRPSDEAIHPAQLDDCRAAIASLVADADTWGIDPARICVAGHAAGGHLAALVGFAASTPGPEQDAAEAGNTAPGGPSAVVVIGAPVHLTTLGSEHDRSGSPASRLIGGPLQELREAAQRASPLAHVSADDPPTLIVHGGRDPGVPVDQAVLLDKTLGAAGVDSTLVILDAATPRPALDQGSPAGTALLEFLDRVIGPGTAPTTRK